MKKRKSFNVILVLVFLAGLSLLLYPTVSNYWNSMRQNEMIARYTEQVDALDEDNYEQLWADARKYNETLREKPNRYVLTEEEQEEYESLLNIADNGILGYIEIPSISCSLPVYHGIDDAILQRAIGHIAGSSLPAGGKGTHCVLSGHRGLPSARLFTDLDRLAEGDRFFLHILDETLAYEVDQILIVEPDQVSSLDIDPEQDYCTLVTCTPYGINTQRLLVRGHRVEYVEGEVHVGADAMQIEPLIVAPVVAVPILLVLLVILLRPKKRRKKTRGNENAKSREDL